jgi:hypothetical protein
MRALSDPTPDRSGHRIDDHGNIYRPGHCSSCKACWINAAAGRCMYGGPVQYASSKIVPSGQETGGKRSPAG